MSAKNQFHVLSISENASPSRARVRYAALPHAATAGHFKTVAILLSLVLAHFCPQVRGSAEDGAFSILDSKLAIEESGAFRRLQWLDDDRVIFTGMPISEVLARTHMKNSGPSYSLRLYVWDTRTNASRVHVEFGQRGGFCYNELENWIRYTVPGKANVVKEGKFGEEQEIDSQKTLQPDGFYHQPTCTIVPYAPKDAGAGERRVFPLFRDHGVLDVFGDQGDARPIKLFSHDYGRFVELALPRRAIAPSKIYYSKFRKAYVLSGFTAPPSFSNPWGTWPEGVNQPIYLLSTDGSLTIGAEIPWHRGYREVLGAYFTARGVVYAGTAPAGKLGLFLLRSGSTIRLVSGSVKAAGESPNGCKVAAAITVEGSKQRGSVRVVDFCNGVSR